MFDRYWMRENFNYDLSICCLSDNFKFIISRHVGEAHRLVATIVQLGWRWGIRRISCILLGIICLVVVVPDRFGLLELRLVRLLRKERWLIGLGWLRRCLRLLYCHTYSINGLDTYLVLVLIVIILLGLLSLALLGCSRLGGLLLMLLRLWRWLCCTFSKFCLQLFHIEHLQCLASHSSQLLMNRLRHIDCH